MQNSYLLLTDGQLMQPNDFTSRLNTPTAALFHKIRHRVTNFATKVIILSDDILKKKK